VSGSELVGRAGTDAVGQRPGVIAAVSGGAVEGTLVTYSNQPEPVTCLDWDPSRVDVETLIGGLFLALANDLKRPRFAGGSKSRHPLVNWIGVGGFHLPGSDHSAGGRRQWKPRAGRPGLGDVRVGASRFVPRAFVAHFGRCRCAGR